MTEIPTSGCWGLKGDEEDFINLNSWDPRQRNLNVYKVVALPIKSEPAHPAPIYPQWATVGEGPSQRTLPVESIPLAAQEVFEIPGSHLLVVVHCEKKVKVAKKKSRTEDTQTSILIPADLKVVDLVKAFKVIGAVIRVSEIPESSNNLQTTDTQTAMELGWKHGTELKLEML